MKISNKIKISIIVLVSTVSLQSCFDDLNLTPNDPNVEQTFNQDAVFAKVYASMSLTGQEGPAGKPDINPEVIDEGTSSFVRMIWNLNELPTDEAICCWLKDEGIPELNSCKWSSSTKLPKGIYARLTFGVTICNHFLDNTKGKTDDTTIRQRAEVRFIRAINYFYLMDFFANPPFAETVSTENPLQIQRADLFNYIENELLAIEPDMFNPKQAPYYRADKVANWLLLSRLYLNAKVYTGTERWNDAAIYAKKVIDDTNYTLCANYSHLFMGDNAGAIDGSVNTAPNEIILPIATDGVQTQAYGGSMFLIASTHTGDMGNFGSNAAWGGNRARGDLARKFFPNGFIPAGTDLTNVSSAAGDDRALFFAQDRTFTVESNGETDFKKGLSVLKFTNLRLDGQTSNDPAFVDMDVPFMRKAEAYLTYAEALTRGASTISGYSALDAVKALRNRAHNTSVLSDVNLDVILNEWSREFYFEGRRRMDLIRFDRFGGSSYNWEWKGGIKEGVQFSNIYNVYPIPDYDLISNPNLEQNKDY